MAQIFTFSSPGGAWNLTAKGGTSLSRLVDSIKTLKAGNFKD